MTVEFYKYQGTGNDFIIIDNRQLNLSKNDTKIIQRLCDRKFGIGADGLIFLNTASQEKDDFEMVYFNADGNESTMCGNGGRCLVAFAKFLNVIDNTANFTAIDGPHEASVSTATVSLKMQDVTKLEELDTALFLDTGSPHYVTICDNVSNLNVKNEGASIRYNTRFKTYGTNVNFVEKLKQNTFKVRTYERGVEDETLSCGTGVTAVALAMHHLNEVDSNAVNLEVEGGKLQVTFEKTALGYQNIWLVGPAQQVFKGNVEWSL